MSKCLHDRVRQSCSACSPEAVYHRYERNAKGRNLTFRLTLEEFEKIVSAPCKWCGENWEPRTVDRVDSRCGYLIWNVQSLCWPCNRFKSCGRLPGQPEDEHKSLAHIQKIAAHQQESRKQKLKHTPPGQPQAVEVSESSTIGVEHGTTEPAAN